MPRFEVQFDDVGFTGDSSLAGSEMSGAQLAEFNALALRNGGFSEQVLAVLGASISNDDGQESADEIKIFATVKLLVEAPDERHAQDILPPDEILNLAAGQLVAGDVSALGLEGNWEAIDAEPHEVRSFRYALVNRPADLGTIPKVPYRVEPRPVKGASHHDLARHGVLVTARALSLVEIRSFELSPFVDEVELHAMAARIADGSMGDYPAEYVEVHRDEPAQFKLGVLQALERVEQGVRYSICDADLLASLVLRKLSLAAAAQMNPAVEAAPRGQ